MAEEDGILFDRVERTACPACHAEIDVAALEPFSLAACPGCGAEMTVPARLATYQLLACLGSGGMGSVYRAYDETLAREVAIKVMKKSLGQQTEFLDSFRREAQAAAKLNHPNIAQIYSFGEEKGQPYIVMEYVPGKHLEDLIEGPDVLDQQMVMKIGLDIADGLQLATASNLIHGDIKPGNILMNDRNAAKLVDFGIASSPDAEQTEIWGTPYYIAPEKVKREKIDFRSDMYCLGGTLYHAITKKPPFDGEDAMAVVKARLAAPPRPLHEFRPDVDPDVERIIMRTLEFDPAKRYASYGDLMADISAYLSKGKTQPVSAGGASKRIVIKSRRGRAGEQDGMTPVPAGAPAAPRTLHVPGDAPGGTPTGGDEEPPRKSSIGKIIGIVVFLLLAAGGGTVGFMMHAKSAKAAQAAADRAALIATQGAALAPMDSVKSAVSALSAKIADKGKSADAIVAEVVAAISKIEGGDVGIRITAESPFEFEPFDDTIDAAPAEAPAEEAKAEGESKDEAAEGDGEAKEESSEGGEEAAAEETSGEEAASDEGDAGDGEAQAEDGASEESTPAAEADVAEASGGEDLEGLPKMARDIFLSLAPVRRACALSPLVVLSVDSLRDAASAVANAPLPDDYEALKTVVEKNRETIGKYVAKARERRETLEEASDGLDKALKEARSALDALTAAVAAAEADAARRAAEEKAAEAERADRERKEAEETARRAAEEAEVASVRAIVPANVGNISSWKIDPVIRELDKLEGGLKSKAGKKALKAEKRRVEAIKSLKEFLIGRLSGDDKFVHPRDRWGVVSADARALEIKPRGKDARPMRRKWDELKPDYVIAMIGYYIYDKDKVKSVPLRERANAYIGAAVYFLVLRGDDEHAVQAAKTYCERVIEEAPSRRNEIMETVYELDFTE